MKVKKVLTTGWQSGNIIKLIAASKQQEPYKAVVRRLYGL